MVEPVDITFYTRPRCCLCDEASVMLEQLGRAFPLRINIVDITRDREAHERWWADIPVVEIGSTVLRAPLDAGRLRLALLHYLRGRP